MAKQIKGCISKGCIANNKKTKYKFDDNFCLKCGNPLVPVCKKCFVPLPEGHKKALCDRCIAEKEDKKDKGAKAAGAASAGVAGVAGVAVVGKKVFDIAKNVIGHKL